MTDHGKDERIGLKGKVLVVDDEASIRNVVQVYLEYHGLTVKTAADGERALEVVREENFDVVLSDIMMPNMDGLALVREVQNVQPNTPVVLMTGYASVNTAVEAIKIGVFDYILKPFQNMQIVLQSVKWAIERRHLILERKELIDNLRSANAELDYNRGLLEDRIQEIDTELSRRVNRLTILYDISRSLTSITCIDDLVRNIMEKIYTAMNDSVGIIWLSEPKSGLLRKVVTKGIENTSVVPESFTATGGEVGETIRSGVVRIFRSVEELSDPVFRRISREENISSILMVPLRYDNDVLGVINVLFKNDYVISEDDISLLEAVADQASISVKNAELYAEQQKMFRETIEALAMAIDSRDNYTSGHSSMVTRYACMIAERMGFDEDRLELIRIAGILHDVGKIGITDAILNKPGRLTDKEMGVIKAHPVLGRFILESIDALKPVARIVYHHHERYDGKGYPDGVAGDDIPLESRILQIADIFDAITSDRVYRKAMPHDKAVAIIRDGLGTVSDPDVGRVFLELAEEGKLLSLLE
ncbi:MAG: response regulator [Candidatus Latescibacteria bacterium]|nr:response regulator [Candidatus Latescibacterota bacterium]